MIERCYEDWPTNYCHDENVARQWKTKCKTTKLTNIQFFMIYTRIYLLYMMQNCCFCSSTSSLRSSLPHDTTLHTPEASTVLFISAKGGAMARPHVAMGYEPIWVLGILALPLQSIGIAVVFSCMLFFFQNSSGLGPGHTFYLNDNPVSLSDETWLNPSPQQLGVLFSSNTWFSYKAPTCRCNISWESWQNEIQHLSQKNHKQKQFI